MSRMRDSARRRHFSPRPTCRSRKWPSAWALPAQALSHQRSDERLVRLRAATDSGYRELPERSARPLAALVWDPANRSEAGENDTGSVPAPPFVNLDMSGFALNRASGGSCLFDASTPSPAFYQPAVNGSRGRRGKLEARPRTGVHLGGRLASLRHSAAGAADEATPEGVSCDLRPASVPDRDRSRSSEEVD